jgi:hypothetical protein
MFGRFCGAARHFKIIGCLRMLDQNFKRFLSLGGEDVRMIFKNRPPKAALLDGFKPRFLRLSKLMPCLIRERKQRPVAGSRRPVELKALKSFECAFVCTGNW